MSDPAATISACLVGTLGRFTLDVAFDIPAHGVTALFGPSGCGKTTLLRAVAGLQRLAGRLSVAGETWQDDAAGVFRKPHRRPIGYVFQEASLFAHLSVRDNLDYGARRAGRQKQDGPMRFDAIVELLGIASLLDRAPLALSGGERQRVAIGRALLSQPRLLLMDEPLAALDRLTKDEFLPYLEALHERLSIPVLYVSHDISEIARLADNLVLVEDGRIRAVGPLTELQADAALPLLHTPDAAVTLDGTITSIDEAYALTSFEVAGGTLIVPGRRGSPGTRRRLRIGASEVSFVLSPAADTTILNCLPARIESVSPHDAEGAQLDIVAALGSDGSGARIVVRVTRRSSEALGLVRGRAVFAQIKSVSLVA